MASFRSDSDIDYAVDFRGSFEKISKQNHRPSYRRSSSPGSVNGIHRRRGSRWTWGHGRGARMANVRAFARCVVMAVAGLCASSALAGTIPIDMVTIGNPGNAADTNGRGSVASEYKIGTYEVTNAQYVQFLNAVDASGSNSLGLWNSSMQSSFRGGILRTGTAATGSKYSTKSGYASRPVNFVSWMDAARFVNWLQTGTTTETGAYDVAGLTPTLRLPTAKYFLPSQDEWYKAAYYNPSLTSYNLYATGTSVNPTAPALTVATLSGTNPATNAAVTNPSATSVVYANNGVAAGNTANVGSAGSQSSYAAFDMNGNVWEFTQTSASAGQVLMYGGGYGQGLSTLARTSVGNSTSVDFTSYENQGAGFRVAAVPEPSTLVMLAGGASVFAVMCGRRRKSRRAGRLPEAPAQE